MAPIYSLWEPKGEELVKWLTNASEPGCPIPRTTVTWADLETDQYFAYSKRQCLGPHQRSLAAELGLPVEGDIENQESVYRYVSFVSNQLESAMWVGKVGPGMMIIDVIMRDLGSSVPWISELTKALYERFFPLSGLRCVLITDVQNVDTVKCVRKICETHELEHPRTVMDDAEWPEGIWTFPSPEFHALLGSRLGKVVAYFILGAYGQGVKRVSRITFFHDGATELNLRFDIEDV
ncbi:uncharacterized protein N7511_000320 [Penicillium nucicola]|uniref:uncharacterized protein n=1 Tax=Penicillium nucicola TaxID=1850975 RepID=UPI002544EB9B|nr:uncharacterized protein N7511_000320 [Penicillium nucicola]KAJ5775309.1 hypothetical protein N7511_000320 [Penicillium nucicola]